MASSAQSVRNVYWNATKITDGAFASADDLGEAAPGTEIPRPTTLTAEGMGYKAETGAQVDFTITVFGTTVDAAITTAKDANPPTRGFIHLINANDTGYTTIECQPYEAAVVPRGSERQRPMVAYKFFGENDSVEDLTSNQASAATYV